MYEQVCFVPNLLCLVPNEGNYLLHDKEDNQLIDRCLRPLVIAVKVKTATQQSGKKGRTEYCDTVWLIDPN